MTDNLTPKDRLKAMRAVKGKDTGLERILFSMLAGMGLNGWRRNAQSVPGKPDVIFPAQRIVVFVDGCFWHGCPHCNRPLPETNQAYWSKKIQRNVERDAQTNDTLCSQGWTVLRIWEHEIKTDSGKRLLRSRMRAALANAANPQTGDQ